MEFSAVFILSSGILSTTPTERFLNLGSVNGFRMARMVFFITGHATIFYINMNEHTNNDRDAMNNNKELCDE
jgi:hypothetical protein